MKVLMNQEGKRALRVTVESSYPSGDGYSRYSSGISVVLKDDYPMTNFEAMLSAFSALIKHETSKMFLRAKYISEEPIENPDDLKHAEILEEN